MSRTRILLAAALTAALLLPCAASAKKPHSAARQTPQAGPLYGARADVVAFASDIAETHGLDAAWALRELAQARRIASVQRLIMPAPAGTTKNWAAYRSRFVEARRIAAGVDFWRQHEAALQRAELRWGVPAQIVVAIIGVETYYGRLTGGYRVIDALATLSFDFPAGRKDRSEFFRGELAEFLVLCLREHLDPQRVKGSFAGAIGLAQFMPSSLNRMAVDFDGDGHIDLSASGDDAVGSVARFLADAGWQRGEPTHFGVAVPVDSAERAALLLPDILPSFSAAQFAERGAVLDAAGRAYAGPLALVELQNGERAASYVAGTRNFYAITRYNWSSYYAMAVIELGAALAAQRDAQPTPR